jgi:LacI family transcriptional regulator
VYVTKRGPTIRDVAKQAGVSAATVSYVLTGRGAVGENTRQRVLDTIQQLAYYPSATARSLNRRRTNTVGFLIPHTSGSVFLDPYFAELIRGVAVMADAHQYSPVIVPVEDEGHAQEIYARLVHSELVDGILVTFISEQHSYLRDDMRRHGIPFVVIGSPMVTDTTFIDVDNRGGAEAAINHLLSLGHRALAFINGPDGYPHAEQRLVGVHSALRAAGIPPDSCPVVSGAFTREGGYAGMEYLLQLDVRATAVFAASDSMAVGALQCLREHGLKVPGDISLVGFDDTLLASATSPALTTVRQPIRALGEAGMDALYKKIHGLPAQSSIILPTELIVRESTLRVSEPSPV